VADRTSRNRPAEGTNGSIKAHQESTTPAAQPLEDDQTLADGEQTRADVDQTASDSDQTAAESDQAASDRDQQASDRDLEHGGDRAVHDATRDVRDRGTRQRDESAETRVESAAARDAVARERDLAALAHDQAAALQDSELAARDAAWAANGAAGAAENRRRASADRAAAAEARERAAADRARAALDRAEAARDRAQAQADREALLRQLALAEVDVLTGARTRGPGLTALDQEIDRARRSTGVLTVAYVDVVGLKAVNDTLGHAAGDALLQRAVRAMRRHLRTYDLIARLGGDEFLCVMSGATIQDARHRFAAVKTALAADPETCKIRVGYATLDPADTGAELIQRADVELSSTRPQ
jgi:diguanylate cyclase (GGDEF)-like protein